MNNSEEINKFLDTYYPPRLNHKSKKSEQTGDKVELIIKALKQKSRIRWLHWWTRLSKVSRFSNSSKILKKRDHIQTHFTRPALEHCIFKTFSHINAYFLLQTIFSKDDHNIVHPTVPSAMWSCHCLNREVKSNLDEHCDGFDQYSTVERTLFQFWARPAINGSKVFHLTTSWGLTLLIIFNLSVSQAISRILYTKANLFVYLKFKFKWASYICFCWKRQPYLKPTDITEVWLIWNYHPWGQNWVARAWKMRHHMGREKTKEQ